MKSRFDEVYEECISSIHMQNTAVIDEEWKLKHPFTFDKEGQDINDLEDKIKSGEVEDTVLVNLKRYEFRRRFGYERSDGLNLYRICSGAEEHQSQVGRSSAR